MPEADLLLEALGGSEEILGAFGSALKLILSGGFACMAGLWATCFGYWAIWFVAATVRQQVSFALPPYRGAWRLAALRVAPCKPALEAGLLYAGPPAGCAGCSA